MRNIVIFLKKIKLRKYRIVAIFFEKLIFNESRFLNVYNRVHNC